jgi:hypothetical protein
MIDQFITLSDEQLEMVAGGQQVNFNATGQVAIANASGNAGNGAANAFNAAAGGLAVATATNSTRQANVAIASIVL